MPSNWRRLSRQWKIGFIEGQRRLPKTRNDSLNSSGWRAPITGSLKARMVHPAEAFANGAEKHGSSRTPPKSFRGKAPTSTTRRHNAARAYDRSHAPPGRCRLQGSRGVENDVHGFDDGVPLAGSPAGSIDGWSRSTPPHIMNHQRRNQGPRHGFTHSP